ncbi:MAG: glycosyltransferase family 4 protein [Chloroflexi bacterium]|nr:glycosyltransferase family 4 protein [Chloroflexota bacterium]
MPQLGINGWFWGQTNTGSGQYLQGLLSHLPQKLPGWNLTLILPALSGYDPPLSLPDQVSVRHQQLPALARGAKLIKLLWEQRTFPTGCKELNADVAFVPYWGSPYLLPCPTVVTIHDLIPLLLPDYASKPTARAYNALISRSARRASVVLTVSQSAHNDIVRYLDIPAQRLHVAYESLGYPHARVDDGTELERVRRAYDLPERYLLYLGGFDPRKNIPLLLRAYAVARAERADLPPLLIAGKLPEPDDTWSSNPQTTLAELDLAQSVRLLGFVPDVDKPALYTLADLFLFPSRYEGFGLPPLEAMACGTPALVSDSSSLPEIVGDTLKPVPANDEQAFARGILDALHNAPEPTRLLAQAARFSWDDTAARVAQVIQGLV